MVSVHTQDVSSLAELARLPSLEKTFAAHLDESDALSSFKDRFQVPTAAYSPLGGSKPTTRGVYLAGGTLGAMPLETRKIIKEELEVWKKRGVQGHFDHAYSRPWVAISELALEDMARIVGSLPTEVAIMNALAVNLHFLLVSFYQPTAERFKILVEEGAYPFDVEAVKSQVRLHGQDAENAVVVVSRRPGEIHLREEDIVSAISEHGSSLCTVLLCGVQPLTGQALDLKSIVDAAHQVGATVGFDLSDAIGILPLSLHDWGVDFAAWSCAKYLCGGPGAIAGAFVHDRYAHENDRPRFAGWWGNRHSERFKMLRDFQPGIGASGYQLSNPCVLTTVCVYASAKIHNEAGLERQRAKSILLTSYLIHLIQNRIPTAKILTPLDPQRRGGQVTVQFTGMKQEELSKQLQARNLVMATLPPLLQTCLNLDPDIDAAVLVFTLSPLYNSFADVWNAVGQIADIFGC